MSQFEKIGRYKKWVFVHKDSENFMTQKIIVADKSSKFFLWNVNCKSSILQQISLRIELARFSIEQGMKCCLNMN